MKKLLLVLFALACTDVPAEPEAVDGTLNARAEKAVYVVTLKEDAPPGLAKKLAGSDLRHEFTAALNGFSARLTPGQAQGIVRNPHVVSIEAVGLATIDRIPWNLDRIDERTHTNKRDYNPASDGAGVRIYVIDTGVLAEHPEFGGRVSAGFSIAPGTPVNMDHGTHVSGTAIGSTVGVAAGANAVDVRVFVSGSAPWDDIIAGIDWVTANAVLPAVANMSFHGEPNDAVDSAVRAMIAAGVLPVTAAGNVSNSACAFSPSRVSETLVAGASTDRDERASFSGRCGCVDLFAPGANVYSATIYRLDRKGNHGYSYKSGTSMAAPHAAGVAAIYLSQNPGASPAEVHDALVANATPGVLELNTSASFCGADGDTPNLLLYTEPASPVGPGKK